MQSSPTGKQKIEVFKNAVNINSVQQQVEVNVKTAVAVDAVDVDVTQRENRFSVQQIEHLFV